jgi:hypothetical protein
MNGVTASFRHSCNGRRKRTLSFMQSMRLSTLCANEPIDVRVEGTNQGQAQALRGVGGLTGGTQPRTHGQKNMQGREGMCTALSFVIIQGVREGVGMP